MENFVNRVEFEALKDEVREIKEEMSINSKLLQSIDKKIDVINEKIITSDKIEDLNREKISLVNFGTTFKDSMLLFS